MRTNFIILILAFNLFSCSTRVDNKKNIKKTGDIILTTIEKIKYENDDKGKIKKEITETYIFSHELLANNFISEKVYEYSKYGELISTKTYDIENGKKLLTELTYNNANYIETFGIQNATDTNLHVKDYYENGLLIKSIRNIKFDGDEKIQEICIKKYNKEKDLIRSEIYDLNNNFQRSNDFTYKTKGNIKEFENKNDKSEIIETGKRIFNKDELICEISEFKGFSIDSLIYSNKKIVKEISVNLKTGKRNIYENKYDSTGRLIERIVQMIVFE